MVSSFEAIFQNATNFLHDSKSTRNQCKRMKMTKLLKEQIRHIWAEQRMAIAIESNVPPSAKYLIKLADKEYTYSDKKQR